MPQAAAAPAAEIALAESFAMAAPEMFAASSTFVPAAGELATLGAMEGMGAAGLGGLSALGAEFGTEALFGGLGSSAPSIGSTVAEGILTGGGGAGTAGINEAMLAQQQANAVAAANSGMTPIATQSNLYGTGLGNVSHQALPGEPIVTYAEQPAVLGPHLPAGVSPASAPAVAPSPTAAPTLYGSASKPAVASVQTYPLGSSAERQALFGNTEGAYGLQGYDNRFMPLEQPTGLQAGFQKALDFAKENPLSTASMGFTAMKLLGSGSGNSTPEKEEYDGILTKYKMSPNFKGRYANPEDFQYTPKVYTNAAEGGIMQAYAGGGPIEAMSNANAVGANTGYPTADINKAAYATPYQTPISRNVITDAGDTGVNPMTGEMRFAKGGEASSKLAMDYYDRMTQQPRAPAEKSDVGIYYDLDPETRYLDALTAAQIRQAKVNKRANVRIPNMKRPTPMGQINLAPPGMKEQEGNVTEAAQGGIMQAKRYEYGGSVDDTRGFGGLAQPAAPAQTATSTPSQAPQASQNSGSWASKAQAIGDNVDSAIRTFLSTPPVLVQAIDGAMQALGIGPYSGRSTMAPGPAVGSQAPGFMQANEGAKQNIAANVSYDGGSSRFGGPVGGGGGGMGNVGIGNGATASGVGTGIGSLGSMGGGLAAGGLSSLGGYAAGGNPRLLKGPGDGMSDNIPATIAGKQPARLADGEFVIPADVVSHLGNGSTEAGAKVLHQMMNKVRKARTGNSKQGKQINPRKFVPT